MTSISSMCSLGTLHQYQSLRGKQLKNPTLGTQGTSAFLGKNLKHHCLAKNACTMIFTQASMKLLYSDEEILSCYEEDVSYVREGCISWMKTDYETVLESHVGDVRKAHAEVREAPAGRHDICFQDYHLDNSLSNCSTVQKRLGIHNWNPRHRRGWERAIKKQTAGKWHIITLQDATEHVDHEFPTNRFHVTHFKDAQYISTRTHSSPM